MKLKTLDNIHFENKIALVRVDYNVPLDENLKIVDDTRITSSLPTLEYLLNHDAKIVLLSHLGKVKSETDKKKFSLAPIAKRLSKIINKNVRFVGVTKGKVLEDAISKMNAQDILMVENTRFEDCNHQAESNCDPVLSKYWASLGDVFVNDAFATIHRQHASNYGIASEIKEKCAGLLLEKEINALQKIVNNPPKPFYVVLGGSKVADKIEVIESLALGASKILIGGAMAYAFLMAQGYEVGKSYFGDEKSINLAKTLLNTFPDKFVVPIDHKVAKSLTSSKSTNTMSIAIDKSDMGLDIGSQTINLYKKILSDAKTIFWNGPLGVYENPMYRKGTLAICQCIGELNDAYSLIGGGDSVAAVNELNLNKKFSYISTGGGALLNFIGKSILPTLEFLKK